jgi:hypothetical protein
MAGLPMSELKRVRDFIEKYHPDYVSQEAEVAVVEAVAEEPLAEAAEN